MTCVRPAEEAGRGIETIETIETERACIPCMG